MLDAPLLDLLGTMLADDGRTVPRVERLLGTALQSYLPAAEALTVLQYRGGAFRPRFVAHAAPSSSTPRLDRLATSDAYHAAVDRSADAITRSLDAVAAGRPYVGRLSDLLASGDDQPNEVMSVLRSGGVHDSFKALFVDESGSLFSVSMSILDPHTEVDPEVAERVCQLASILRAMLGAPLDREVAGGRASDLSDREADVLRYALTGLTEKQIALRLHRSPHTVHSHLKSIYRRMGVSSRAELLAMHLRPERDAGSA
jgi:DNA-binding CsgD family transcriptional regulator